MSLAMVSLAGVPPLVGFFGKFLLLKAVAERAVLWSGYYWLLGIAIVGVVISIWYYFGVIRAIYWSEDPADLSPIAISLPARISLGVCLVGMLYFGILPGAALGWANEAARVFRF
jgi:NADH-quinone oxidoreductase subunit N